MFVTIAIFVTQSISREFTEFNIISLLLQLEVISHIYYSVNVVVAVVQKLRAQQLPVVSWKSEGRRLGDTYTSRIMLEVRGKSGFQCPVAQYGECRCQQCGACVWREERISSIHYETKINFEAKSIPITLISSLPSDESKITLELIRMRVLKI